LDSFCWFRHHDEAEPAGVTSGLKFGAAAPGNEWRFFAMKIKGLMILSEGEDASHEESHHEDK
jgi:hypothetical protein